MTFPEKLQRAMQSHRSLLCIGLDPNPSLMPVPDVAEFNRAIIEATWDLVCAYKPNLAYYEALGVAGLVALEKTLSFIPAAVPTIGDAKRGDVEHTAQAYAQALFSQFGFDAVTVNPYLGSDSVVPFLSYRDKGVFILCRTSNPGSADFQSLLLSREGERPRALFELVALKALEWNQLGPPVRKADSVLGGRVGLVVGATYPQELKRVRELCPQLPILIPGIGAQGGDLELTLRYGADAQGTGVIIAASRSIIYASRDKDFAAQARAAALRLREQINVYRGRPPGDS